MNFEGLVNVRKAITSLNPKLVREMSGMTLTIGLHAPNQTAYQQMEDFFLQELKPTRRRESAALLAYPSNASGHHVAVYHESMAAPSKALIYSPSRPQLLVSKALSHYPDLGVSLAKSFVPFRAALS